MYRIEWLFVVAFATILPTAEAGCSGRPDQTSCFDSCECEWCPTAAACIPYGTACSGGTPQYSPNCDCSLHDANEWNCLNQKQCQFCADSPVPSTGNGGSCVRADAPCIAGSTPVQHLSTYYDPCVMYTGNNYQSNVSICINARNGCECGFCAMTIGFPPGRAFEFQGRCMAGTVSGPFASGVDANCNAGWTGPTNSMDPACPPPSPPPSTVTPCNTLFNSGDCQAQSGCGWCTQNSNGNGGSGAVTTPGTCYDADPVLNKPARYTDCTSSLSFHSGTSFYLGPSGVARVDPSDPCADIPADRCTQICGCGLCESLSGKSSNQHYEFGQRQGVCMSGNMNSPSAKNYCPDILRPDLAQWVFEQSNNNQIACQTPTPIPDPCGAYPVPGPQSPTVDVCETHCGCTACYDQHQSGRFCVSKAGTIDINGQPDVAMPLHAGFQCDSHSDSLTTTGSPTSNCFNTNDNSCWRRPKEQCGVNSGVVRLRLSGTDKYDDSNFDIRRGCGWCDDGNYQGCVPVDMGDSFNDNQLPDMTRQHSPVGQRCANLSFHIVEDRTDCGRFREQYECTQNCKCGWCTPADGSGGACYEADRKMGRFLFGRQCLPPAVWTPPRAQMAYAIRADDDSGFECDQDLDTSGIYPTRIEPGDISNLSLVGGCLLALVLALCWFHSYHRKLEETPGEVPLRRPFPASTESELNERTIRKFLRLVQLYHPITMLLYAAERDGFDRSRRFFCVFVALSCQFTVTLGVLLTTIPAYGASLLSAAVSFVYEKPIVKLVKFTGRQECCGSCCNCFTAMFSYCFVVFCFIQIPIVLGAFGVWYLVLGGNRQVAFGYIQVFTAWAASIALGYVTTIGSLLVRFCCCPGKYTQEMNEYALEYEKFEAAKRTTAKPIAHTPVEMITLPASQPPQQPKVMFAVPQQSTTSGTVVVGSTNGMVAAPGGMPFTNKPNYPPPQQLTYAATKPAVMMPQPQQQTVVMMASANQPAPISPPQPQQIVFQQPPAPYGTANTAPPPVVVLAPQHTRAASRPAGGFAMNGAATSVATPPPRPQSRDLPPNFIPDSEPHVAETTSAVAAPPTAVSESAAVAIAAPAVVAAIDPAVAVPAVVAAESVSNPIVPSTTVDSAVAIDVAPVAVVESNAAPALIPVPASAPAL